MGAPKDEPSELSAELASAEREACSVERARVREAARQQLFGAANEPVAVGRFEVVERLGEGGMGVVYKAEDTSLKRPVALKFLAPDLSRDKEAKTRFLREAQAASSLSHQHIATIHEIGEAEESRSSPWSSSKGKA